MTERMTLVNVPQRTYVSTAQMYEAIASSAPRRKKYETPQL